MRKLFTKKKKKTADNYTEKEILFKIAENTMKTANNTGVIKFYIVFVFWLSVFIAIITAANS